jgi:hypothetical protein
MKQTDKLYIVVPGDPYYTIKQLQAVGTATIAPVKINRVTMSGEDSSFTEIITIAVPIEGTAKYSGEYSYSDLKAAIERANREIEQLHIGPPCSVYDCTGRAFTLNLEVLNRYHHCDTLVYVIKHHVCVDI